MRDAFPLTDFDFWAFLTSGAVMLAAADRVFGLGWMARENWTFVQVGLAAALAYVVGHVVAEIASRLLEGWLVQRVLGTPSKLLLATDAPRPRGYWLYSSYFNPVSPDLRARIDRRAARSDPPLEANALYTTAYILARRDTLAAGRLSTFQNQYSMCRNVCLASFLAAPALAVAGLHAGRPADLWWAAAALVVAAVMLIRFLKYYRLFSVEVLNAYAGGAGGS
jgi:hypothetical protein